MNVPMSDDMAGANMANQNITRAHRLRFRRWRDPRLLLGIFLVTTSVLVGSLIFAERDNTVEYWSLRSDVKAGERVERSSLQPMSVRLGSGAKERYLRVTEALPARLGDLVWTHDASRGELVTHGALSPAAMAGAELPLNVAAGSFPADLHSGDLVDVWVGPEPGEMAEPGAERVMAGVTVLSTGDASGSVGGSLASTILVGIGQDELRSEVVAAVSAGHVTVVRVP